jgi:hypothetical protein
MWVLYNAKTASTLATGMATAAASSMVCSGMLSCFYIVAIVATTAAIYKLTTYLLDGRKLMKITAITTTSILKTTGLECSSIKGGWSLPDT